MVEMQDDDEDDDDADDDEILTDCKDHLEKEYYFHNKLQNMPLLTHMIEE